ncbi:MAG: hypothetical protein IT423_17475 [Pirellulaceae bacterium]|nr:hypothetical protein [Pirellulaceae bacterium]
MTSFWVPLESNLGAPGVLTGWMLVLRYLAFSALAIALMFGATALMLEKRIGMTGR